MAYEGKCLVFEWVRKYDLHHFAFRYICFSIYILLIIVFDYGTWSFPFFSTEATISYVLLKAILVVYYNHNDQRK